MIYLIKVDRYTQWLMRSVPCKYRCFRGCLALYSRLQQRSLFGCKVYLAVKCCATILIVTSSIVPGANPYWLSWQGFQDVSPSIKAGPGQMIVGTSSVTGVSTSKHSYAYWPNSFNALRSYMHGNQYGNQSIMLLVWPAICCISSSKSTPWRHQELPRWYRL